MHKAWVGHAFIIFTQVLLGINIPITRDLLLNYLSPLGYIAVRAVAAALFFWSVQCLLPREKIERRDFFMILLGGFLGFVLSQYLTSLSLIFTTPVYFALILALSPVFVLLLEAVFFHERINRRKLIGVALGIAGAALLAVRSIFDSESTGSNNLLGIGIAVLSIGSFAVYVVICTDISRKYQPITQMKWIFTLSSGLTLPLLMLSGSWRTQPLLTAPDWHIGVLEIAFIIVFCTICAYTLIPLGLRTVSASAYSIYMNLQPVTAAITAIAVGMDAFSWDKPLALLLVLSGAYIVTARHSRHGPVRER
ncbi:MAG: EamA family transporter [Proteobacteria bacterium]|uniref:EamA family transporter n=1 Tax=Candidatus Avisuccinivibrio stercorigallinarum TaxID=2840704 RepID=A0A9D9D9N2_9GAMM|nr:EamA family transporter [Candidatus Avisuccinivibrio stercorigallinarum]